MKLRIVIIDRQALVSLDKFCFVGFFGTRQKNISPEVKEGIEEADKQLVAELPTHAGMHAYCTLFPSVGDPFNLVVFAPDRVRIVWMYSHTHLRAVRDLAPSYYTTVRIHNGVLPNNLRLKPIRTTPIFVRTKFYEFADGTMNVNSCEYENASAQSICKYTFSHPEWSASFAYT